MTALDLAKLTIGTLTAALVVGASVWMQWTMRQGFEDLRTVVRHEQLATEEVRQTAEDHEEKIDDLQRDVEATKKTVKAAKPLPASKVVPTIVAVAVPTVIAVVATPTPAATPEPKGILNLWKGKK